MMKITRPIIHLVSDEKFIDIAIRDFELAESGIHQFIVLDKSPPYRYIKSLQIEHLKSIEFINQIAHSATKAIFIHGLTTDKYALIPHIPATIRLIWIGWGYDYYHLLAKDYPEYLLLEQTKKLNPVKLKSKLRKLYEWYRRSTRMSFLNRVHYFSPVLDIEYQLFRKANNWFKPQYVEWNYGNLEEDFSISNSKVVSQGKNILIGNSATATNNHLDTFIAMKNLDLTDRKVIVPLSYGEEGYKQAVIAQGAAVFGDQFHPLTDFMDKDKYSEVISSCEFVFMNHLRQQGLGNLLISIMAGSKIFLNEQNPLYKWFINKGLIVGSMSKLDLVPLSPEQIERNKALVKAHWGEKVKHDKTKKLIKLALS